MQLVQSPDLSMALRQNQIITPSDLLNGHGELVQRGYCTKPLLHYDRKKVGLPHRLKEWDYYLVMDRDFCVALTIDDNYYMGLSSVSILDFRNVRECTRSFVRAMPMSTTDLPNSSGTGDVFTSSLCCKNKYNFKFAINPDKSRTLSCFVAHFTDSKDLMVKITLTDEPADSMVIATPFKTPRNFYYNQKIIGFRATGDVILGNQVLHHFEQNTAQALLDWGRGVWEYESTWFWSAGMFYTAGHKIGFNLGYGFGDTSAATENMVFVDGKAYKLDQINFDIPAQKNGACDFMATWTFSSSDRRFECTFKPLLNRKALMSVGVLMSDQNQVFGFATGYFVTDDGQKHQFENELIFAEKVHNKW